MATVEAYRLEAAERIKGACLALTAYRDALPAGKERELAVLALTDVLLAAEGVIHCVHAALGTSPPPKVRWPKP